MSSAFRPQPLALNESGMVSFRTTNSFSSSLKSFLVSPKQKRYPSLMKKLHLYLAAIVSLALSLQFGCTTALKKAEAPKGPRVTIMSYNVENLFDTVHDENREDFTFLPKSLKTSGPFKVACEKQDSDYRRKECLETDWSEAALKEKIRRLKDVIQQVGDGKGPDIQILVEVENKNALELLNKQLPESKYNTVVLLEGPDMRGIDPGILSRFPEWDKPKMHIIPYKPENPEDAARTKSTRGILEARLLLPDGQKLSVFAVHFPSQSNPSYLRKQAVEFLNKLKSELPPDVLAIAAGDFNVAHEEESEKNYYRTTLNSHWLVSHLIGCKGCQGTHYYHPKRSWSFLDVIAFSPKMKAGTEGATWVVDPQSIRIPAESRYQTNKWGSPARFDLESSTGVADHFPLYAEIYKPE